MKIEIINTSSEVVPTPSGRLEPFEIGDVSKSWLHKHSSHGLKTPQEYDTMIRGLERKHLIAHVKKRRRCTGEDLAADGATDEMREQLLIADADSEAA